MTVVYPVSNVEPSTYHDFRTQLVNYNAFLACLASCALRGVPAVASTTSIQLIRDSTYQNPNLRRGSLFDHFLACLAAVAVQKAL